MINAIVQNMRGIAHNDGLHWLVKINGTYHPKLVVVIEPFVSRFFLVVELDFIFL